MKTDIETQVREFAIALADSLPEIDASDIRLGPDSWMADTYETKPSAEASSRPRLRGPLVAAGAGLLVVMLVAVPVFLLDGGSTDDVGVGSSTLPAGLGINGTYFILEDASWELIEAWAEEDDATSTFSLYDRGDQHVSILTGSMAKAAMAARNDARTDTVNAGETEVVERTSPSGIHYSWLTSEGLHVVVNFAHMNREEARQAAAGLRTIHTDTWVGLIAQSDGVEIRAHTGFFGGGGEEGLGELIRLDAPDAASVILEMGKAIELPPGGSFDRFVHNLPAEPTTMTEDSIMSTLEFNAACSWTGYWLEAVSSGDTAAQTDALAVLQEIPSWPALNASDGGGVIDALIRNAQMAAAGDAKGVRDNLYTNNCTDMVPWE